MGPFREQQVLLTAELSLLPWGVPLEKGKLRFASHFRGLYLWSAGSIAVGL